VPVLAPPQPATTTATISATSASRTGRRTRRV
jgi:hypothetical protein